MLDVISYIVFIILVRFFDNNNTFFIKKVKNYQKNLVLGFCVISYKVDDCLANQSKDKFLPRYEPASIIPKKLVRIKSQNPNKIIKKYYPKVFSKVKPTPFFEQKDLILLLFLLFLFLLFFLLLYSLMKNKYPDLQEKLQPESSQDFTLKKKLKSKNKLKLRQKLKTSDKLKHYFNALLKVSTLVLREALFFNETIYLDKVKDNER